MIQLRTIALMGCLLTGGCTPAEPTVDPASWTASELAARLATGEITAVSATRAYLDRIEELDDRGPALHAILELNSSALEEAAALDAMWVQNGPVGPLHGVPVVIKANINVAGLAASAGSVVLAAHRPERDAHLVAKLRMAGAVVLATTNLSEWANFRDRNSSSGWSSLGGQTRNPHVLDRNPCGSSSGSAVAVAARLAPLAVGTETNGSIVCPAGLNGIVGIKPTVGLVSRSGIIPISHTQDTAGPMARTVTDAALLLQVMIGHDDGDPDSLDMGMPPLIPRSDPADLTGRRIGILRSYLGAGTRPRVERIFENAVGQLRALGAELVDPIEYQPPPEMRAASYRILLREFKAGLNQYLSNQRLPDDRNSLADLITFNESHAGQIMPHFGQSIFIEAVAMTGLDDPAYVEDLALAQERLRDDLKDLFDSHKLDAIFFPVTGPAWKTDWVNGDSYGFGGTAGLAAITGYPSIVLPAGVVNGLPVGVGFVGLAFSDAELVQMAYAVEQLLPRAPDPAFRPTLESL